MSAIETDTLADAGRWEGRVLDGARRVADGGVADVAGVIAPFDLSPGVLTAQPPRALELAEPIPTGNVHGDDQSVADIPPYPFRGAP